MPGFEPSCTPSFSSEKMQPLTTGPCDHCAIHVVKLIALKYFSVWTLWSCIYHEFKDTFEEKYLKRVFQNYFALFPCLFTLGLYIGSSINGLVFFFAALAEVQVTVLLVLNLPRQRMSSQLSNWALLCLQPAVICLRNTLRFANVK